jgi:hypothetical protein
LAEKRFWWPVAANLLRSLLAARLHIERLFAANVISRPIAWITETTLSYTFTWALRLRFCGSRMMLAEAVETGLVLDPMFTMRRMRRMSEHPTFRAQSKRI